MKVHRDIRMVRWLLSSGFLALVTANVWAAGGPAAKSESQQKGNGFVTISVLTGRMLAPVEGAAVTLVVGDCSLREIGRTDSEGRLRVRQSLFREDDARLMLVCARSFYCAAVILKDFPVGEFQKVQIALANLVLVN